MNKPKDAEEALRRLSFERMGQAISVIESSSPMYLRTGESSRATGWANPTSNNRSTNHQMEEQAPRTKLFVGHLADTCTKDDLLILFSKIGEVVECDVIKNYGFVHMSKPVEAERAIKELNNYELKGSSISVERSKSKLHLTPRHHGRTNGDPNSSTNDRRPMNDGQNNDLQSQRNRRIPNDVQQYNLSSPNSSHFTDRPNFAQTRPQTQSHMSFQQPSTISGNQWYGGNFRGPSTASTSGSSMKSVMQPRSGLANQSTPSYSGSSRYCPCPDTSSPTFNTNDLYHSAFWTSPIASHNPYTSASTLPLQHETVERHTSAAPRMQFSSRSPPRNIDTVPSQNRPWYFATSANMTPNQTADLTQGPYYQPL